VAEQQKRDDFGITEDDVMEVRQDISTLRYEIVDILRNNGMSTPNLDPNDSSSKSNQPTKFLETIARAQNFTKKSDDWYNLINC